MMERWYLSSRPTAISTMEVTAQSRHCSLGVPAQGPRAFPDMVLWEASTYW